MLCAGHAHHACARCNARGEECSGVCAKIPIWRKGYPRIAEGPASNGSEAWIVAETGKQQDDIHKTASTVRADGGREENVHSRGKCHPNANRVREFFGKTFTKSQVHGSKVTRLPLLNPANNICSQQNLAAAVVEDNTDKAGEKLESYMRTCHRQGRNPNTKTLCYRDIVLFGVMFSTVIFWHHGALWGQTHHP